MKTLPPLLSLLAAAGLCGCDGSRKPKAASAAPASPHAAVPAPKPTAPPVQRLQGDRLRMHEPMKFEDLSFMLRTGTGEAEMLKAISERGFFKSLTTTQVQLLGTYGASPKVLAAVQDPKNVLTSKERNQYFERENERTAANRKPAKAGSQDAQKQAVEFAERQRKIDLQQASLAATKAKQEMPSPGGSNFDPVARRAYLENEKKKVVAAMDSYRKAGYREDQLTEWTAQLKKIEDELAALK